MLVEPAHYLADGADALDSGDDRQGHGEVETPAPPRSKGTVLVVLAEADKRQQLAEALAHQGCGIWLAASAAMALEIARTRQPNLIVLETVLAGQDGFQVCAELHDNQVTRHIPVILLSPDAVAGDKIRGLRMGAVDYLAPPFDWPEVAAQICSQLKLDRLRGELEAVNCDLLAKQNRHQASMTAAAGIQQSLLPVNSVENFDDLRVAWEFLPLEQVGGDLLGYTWLDDDNLAVYVVDVCGHGLPAAMMTAAIASSLAPATTPDALFSPGKMLEQLDREYPVERFDRPFTICYLVLNRRTGEFRCSRAGHPMPIIIRGGGQLESIEAGGTIIGLDRMLPFEEDTGRLSPGDSILLYSDGVTECTGNSGPFGLNGLTQLLRQCVGLPPASICGKIVTSLRQFTGGAAMQDDVTILALTYDGGGHLAGESIAERNNPHLPHRGN
jgi:sigma-B regulation protein RsbU (phosphoserine phosphatase)